MKGIKHIPEDDIISLFNQFETAFQNVDNLLKNNIEISSFYLHCKMETLRDLMKSFQIEHKINKN